MFKHLFTISALLFLMALPGCGYSLPGRVVSGRYNTVELVSSDDPRLKDAGMPGVRIELIRDPDSLGKSVAASTSSGGSGNISIRLAEIGVGWLDEEWDIRALMGSDEFATSRIRLPRRHEPVGCGRIDLARAGRGRGTHACLLHHAADDHRG